MDEKGEGDYFDSKGVPTSLTLAFAFPTSGSSEKGSIDQLSSSAAGQQRRFSVSNSLANIMPPDGERAAGGATGTGLESITARGADGEANTGPDKNPLPFWRLGLLGIGICLGLFLAMLDTSIVATCLYSIAVEFEALDSINWVALSYTLSYLGCAVIFSRISDVIGRKAAFLAAFAIFIAFSIGCGFAQSINQLIVLRALQGLGGSGLYSIAIIIFPELTPSNKRHLISISIGLVIAAAGVLGPVIGGLLTHYKSWRYVFWINGPIGGVSAFIFWLAWPEEKHLPNLERRSWKDLDYLGSFLLVSASVLVVFSFQNASVNANQWGQAVFIVPLILGIFSLVSLFAWEYFIERRWKGRKAAAVPLELLRNRVYTTGMISTMLLGFPYLSSIYTFPIRFQVVNGKSALEAGLLLLPMLVATAAGSTVGGMINGKKNRIFESFLLAYIFMLIGCALETTASESEEVEPKVIGFLPFIGFGFGISATASTILAGIECPVREHAPAQGIFAQVRILGGSLGIAASSAILGVQANAELTGVLTPGQMQHLESAVSTMTAGQRAAVRRAYTHSLRQEMNTCVAILAVGIVISFGIYSRTRPTIQERQRERHIEEFEHRQKARAMGAGRPAGHNANPSRCAPEP